MRGGYKYSLVNKIEGKGVGKRSLKSRRHSKSKRNMNKSLKQHTRKQTRTNRKRLTRGKK